MLVDGSTYQVDIIQVDSYAAGIFQFHYLGIICQHFGLIEILRIVNHLDTVLVVLGQFRLSCTMLTVGWSEN